jgi:ribonuclease VapC
MSGDPAVRHCPDTDTMHVEIRPGPAVAAEEASPDLVIHHDDQDRPVGYEIEHASRNPNHIAEAIRDDRRRLISAASALETAMVVESELGEAGARELDRLLAVTAIEIVAFTPEQPEIAGAAFRRFGKGRHPAALDFGDRMSYALARLTGEPLLFNGNDFSRTDLRLCDASTS